jgi:threonine/homoserine/homoserine lactone efflux protein
LRETGGVTRDLLAFLGIAVLVIVTPGQDTALTIRNTLSGDRRNGVFTALGVASGQAAWTVAASAGIAALLVASERAFVALKLVGAAYLVYLGARTLIAAARRRSAPRTAAPIERRSSGIAYRQGLLSNLGNPKMAVFFTSLLPQFTASFAAMLALGLVFCTMTFSWLTAYAFAVAKAGDFLRRTGVARLLDALTGAVLVALGFRIATERR